MAEEPLNYTKCRPENLPPPPPLLLQRTAPVLVPFDRIDTNGVVREETIGSQDNNSSSRNRKRTIQSQHGEDLFPVKEESVHKPTESVHKQTESVHKPTESVHKPTESVHKQTESVHKQTESVHELTVREKYSQLLSLIDDMSRDLKQAYAGSKSSTERLKRSMNQAKLLVRELLLDSDRRCFK